MPRQHQVHELVSGKNQDVAWTTGDIDAGMVTVGMCGGLIDDIPTCAELVDIFLDHLVDATDGARNKLDTLKTVVEAAGGMDVSA